MFKSITDFFHAEIGGKAETKADSERKVRTATCVLLLELAWSDGVFGPAEREAIVAVLQDRFGMNVDSVVDLLDTAEAVRNDSTDIYQFTKLIRDNLDEAEILEIVASLWEVVYSDGLLEAHEDALMHKLSRLLGIGHREMIAMKLRAKSG